MKITKEEAQQNFKQSADWLQKKLIEEFGKEAFVENKWDLLDSFDACCHKVGTTEEAFNERFNKLGLDEDTVVYEKLKICRNAISGNWILNWKDPNQKKWTPVINRSAGSGFSRSRYGYVNTITDAGSRLWFETEEQSDHFGRTFIDLILKF